MPQWLEDTKGDTMTDQEMTLTFTTAVDAVAFEKWLINNFASFAGDGTAEAELVSNRYAEGITLTGADGPE